MGTYSYVPMWLIVEGDFPVSHGQKPSSLPWVMFMLSDTSNFFFGFYTESCPRHTMFFSLILLELCLMAYLYTELGRFCSEQTNQCLKTLCCAGCWIVLMEGTSISCSNAVCIPVLSCCWVCTWTRLSFQPAPARLIHCAPACESQCPIAILPWFRVVRTYVLS